MSSMSMAYRTQSSEIDEFEFDEFGMFKFGFIIAGAGFNAGGNGTGITSMACGIVNPSLAVKLLMPEYLIRGCDVLRFFNNETALLIEMCALEFFSFSIDEMRFVCFGSSSVGFGVVFNSFVIDLSKL